MLDFPSFHIIAFFDSKSLRVLPSQLPARQNTNQLVALENTDLSTVFNYTGLNIKVNIDWLLEYISGNIL